MKGDLTYNILRFIEDGITTFVDLEAAIIVSGYGASGKKIDLNFEKFHHKRKFLTDWLYSTEEGRKEKRRLKKFISRLKIQGLVDMDVKGGLSLTNFGRLKSIQLKIKKKHTDFETQPDKTFKIVAFDIPTSKNSNRDWLRSSLRNMGFEMLQKSVWVGKRKIPESFLRSLEDFGLLDCVEIAEITKSGSLKQL